MRLWQRKAIATDLPAGPPRALPAELVGLDELSLANLDWADPALGYSGFGFVPVEVPDPPPPLPTEIPMHKAAKALKMLGPAGSITADTYDSCWWVMVIAAIDAIGNLLQRDCIYDELNRAPNLVLAGATTLSIKTAIGMTDAQLEDVARLALTLP